MSGLRYPIKKGSWRPIFVGFSATKDSDKTGIYLFGQKKSKKLYNTLVDYHKCVIIINVKEVKSHADWY